MVREKARLVRQPPFCLVSQATPALLAPQPPPCLVAASSRVSAAATILCGWWGLAGAERAQLPPPLPRQQLSFALHILLHKLLDLGAPAVGHELQHSWKGEGYRALANDGRQLGRLLHLQLLLCCLLGQKNCTAGQCCGVRPTKPSIADLLAETA